MMPLRTRETIACWFHYRAWIIPSPLSLLQTKPSSFSLSLQVGHVCTALICPALGCSPLVAALPWWLLQEGGASFSGGQQGHHQAVPNPGVMGTQTNPTALGTDDAHEQPWSCLGAFCVGQEL